MLEEGDDALPQPHGDGRHDGCAADRDVDQLAGVLLLALAHEAAQHLDAHALVPTTVGRHAVEDALRATGKGHRACGHR
jgi:hypothetical protein